MPKFKPRQRKHKASQKGHQHGSSNLDTNVIELQTFSKSEKDKHQMLKEEQRAQQPKISRQKQKRFDKYIQNKLKKDENLALLKKLSLAKIDTAKLQSSRHLGNSRKASSSKVPAFPLAADTKNGSLQSSTSSDDQSEDSVKPSGGRKHQAPKVPAAGTPTIGSGLKRPLDVGPDGLPIIKRRKGMPKARLVRETVWEGFGSDEGLESINKAQTIASGSGGSGSEGGSSDDDSESTSCEDGGRGHASEDGEDSTTRPMIRPRRSAFKAWAIQQINEAVGFNPTEHAHSSIPKTQQISVSKASSLEMDEHLPPELQITKGDPNRKVFTVQVDRPHNVQVSRLGLPVVGEEQKIMEAIHNNSSVIVWGATGSGKTTQLPQFLFEAGYGNPQSPNPGIIGITQPRRVAAVSMAKRVGDELGQFCDQVSYQIRFDSTVSSKTAIKFMTDGVLLREIAQDFALSKYSVIIVDEAHERSVNTDILIGMVSRILDLRNNMSEKDPNVKPLKLVIMSATLRISDLVQNTNLFRHGAPPLVQAEGRQYPVTIHFARRTHRDYVEETFRKVSKGHRKLPPGGFLVFLTGQNEIRDLAKRLEQTFKSTSGPDISRNRVHISAAEAPLEAEDIELDGIPVPLGDEDNSDVELTGLDDPEEEDFDSEGESVDPRTRVHILPLYSQLPTKEQLKVFEAPPERSRLIVLATNVAETSLTIPDIRYVFDCGRSKERQYDISTGVQRFQVGWISKASASQRAGRAGRTGPGHCYRLYSSAVYERDFLEFMEPEILRTPIEEVVLQIKSIGLHHVINFPFPTPPSRLGLAKAEKLLKNLGALSVDGRVTDIGRRLTLYPLSPRFGKMLQIGHQHGCMPYVIAMVSALAVGELFIQESQIDMVPLARDDDRIYTNADRLEDTSREMRRKDYDRARRIFSKHDDKSDVLKFLTAVCAYSYASDGDAFCNHMFLRPNALKEALGLRRQLTDIVRSNNPWLIGSFQARLVEPSDKQLRALKQITAAGFIDKVAIRMDLAPVPQDIRLKPKRAVDVPYITLLSSHEGVRETMEKAVYIHASSVLSQLSPNELPQYLIYSHLQQAASSHINDKASKIRMFPLTAISGLQLSALAHGTPLIEYGKPIGKTESLGGSPERRECWVIPSLIGEPGSMGWPLPAKKVIQKKDMKQGWVVEKFIK